MDIGICIEKNWVSITLPKKFTTDHIKSILKMKFGYFIQVLVFFKNDDNEEDSEEDDSIPMSQFVTEYLTTDQKELVDEYITFNLIKISTNYSAIIGYDFEEYLDRCRNVKSSKFV